MKPISRRAFLARIAALGSLSPFLLSGASSRAALGGLDGDYKAMVAVFLQGGADACHLVVPTDADRYALYKQARQQGAAALADLAPIRALNTGENFGLTTPFAPLKGLWDQGKMAMIANVGTLRAPITKEQYLAGTGDAPSQLFSHDDQKLQWEAGNPRQLSSTGWGGRLADAVAAQYNRTSRFPPILDIGLGLDVFTVSAGALHYSLPSYGEAVSPPRTGLEAETINALLQQNSGNVFEQEFARIATASVYGEQQLSGIANDVRVGSAFAGLIENNYQITGQLQRIANIIAGYRNQDVRRQLFVLSFSGFDNHIGLTPADGTNRTMLASSIKAFWDAMAALQLDSQVTMFTMSEFGRTFAVNVNQGTDHGWGSQHFVMGGAVNGGNIVGSYPDLRLGGPSDVTGGGVWVPTLSTDQYAATLAKWFGVAAADMDKVLPNIGSFAQRDLGFMRNG